MIESGFPWCVDGDQDDIMAYFKHKHHAEAFCLLANWNLSTCWAQQGNLC